MLRTFDHLGLLAICAFLSIHSLHAECGGRPCRKVVRPGGCSGPSCGGQGVNSGGCSGGNCGSGSTNFAPAVNQSVPVSGFESVQGLPDARIQETSLAILKAAPSSQGELRTPKLEVSGKVRAVDPWDSRFLRVDQDGSVRVLTQSPPQRFLRLAEDGTAYVKDPTNGGFVELKRGSGLDANGEFTLDNDERLLRDIGWLVIKEKIGENDPRAKAFMNKYFKISDSGAASGAGGGAAGSGGGSEGVAPGHGDAAESGGGANRPAAERDESTLAPPDGGSPSVESEAIRSLTSPEAQRAAKLLSQKEFEEKFATFAANENLDLRAKEADVAKEEHRTGSCVSKEGGMSDVYLHSKNGNYDLREVAKRPSSQAEAIALASTPSGYVTDKSVLSGFLTLSRRSNSSTAPKDVRDIQLFKDEKDPSALIVRIIPDGKPTEERFCTLRAVPQIARQPSAAPKLPDPTVKLSDTDAIIAAGQDPKELAKVLQQRMINAEIGTAEAVPTADGKEHSTTKDDAIRRTQVAAEAFEKKWTGIEKQLRDSGNGALADSVAKVRTGLSKIYADLSKPENIVKDSDGHYLPGCAGCSGEAHTLANDLLVAAPKPAKPEATKPPASTESKPNNVPPSNPPATPARPLAVFTKGTGSSGTPAALKALLKSGEGNPAYVVFTNENGTCGFCNQFVSAAKKNQTLTSSGVQFFTVNTQDAGEDSAWQGVPGAGTAKGYWPHVYKLNRGADGSLSLEFNASASGPSAAGWASQKARGSK